MTMRQHCGRPERLLRDHADDDGLGRALAEGTPAAITDAVARIRDAEAAALDQLRTLLRP
ncbi:hypothetical protein KXR53_34535 [Inquilinus limosus]|uniref:hypothetical protein n=1 Tax=Inquilinus limosus TaxID=171674 RepID=UPI003F14B3F0